MQPGPSLPPSAAPTLPPGRFLVAWALGWAFVGVAVALGIVSVTQGELRPVVRLSLPFAEVVGFTALVSARLIFPLFVRLPRVVKLLLQVLTLLSGTVFGSVAVIMLQPLYFLNRPRVVALTVLVNAVIAVAVGIAIYTYDKMRRQLEQSYEALRVREALVRELRIARDVQQELLPRSVPEIDGLELAGVCIPAKGVGGDYYDFLQLSRNEVGLVVADVSGKGIPAALLMACLHASVRSLVLPEVEPARLNGRLNEILHGASDRSRYATMFLGFYDGERRTLHYSNAGHHPPLLVSDGTASSLDAGGLPIGMFDRVDYHQDTQQLASGDLLGLFTDGVVETPNAEGEEFGSDRLLELLRQHRTLALDRLVAIVLDELRTWSGDVEPHDDVTLVLARQR